MPRVSPLAPSVVSNILTANRVSHGALMSWKLERRSAHDRLFSKGANRIDGSNLDLQTQALVDCAEHSPDLLISGEHG